jgi:hypothetical protein
MIRAVDFLRPGSIGAKVGTREDVVDAEEWERDLEPIIPFLLVGRRGVRMSESSTGIRRRILPHVGEVTVRSRSGASVEVAGEDERRIEIGRLIGQSTKLQVPLLPLEFPERGEPTLAMILAGRIREMHVVDPDRARRGRDLQSVLDVSVIAQSNLTRLGQLKATPGCAPLMLGVEADGE